MKLHARSTLVFFLSWSILASALATEPLAVVEMLARGTIVPRFGTIGEAGVFAQGIDARGRVLFIGTLDDGRQGLFWGQAGSYETLWLPDEFKGLIGMAVTNGEGQVVMTRRDREGVWRFLERVIGPDQTAVVAKVGDIDSEGFTIVELRGVRLDDSGTIGFAAEVAPIGQDCAVDQCGIHRAIYVAVEGGLKAIAREGVGGVETIDHIDAILNDGSVLFGGDAIGEHGIFRATPTTVEPYEDLRSHPGTYVITRSLGASPNGVVALEMENEGVRGVYRVVDSTRELVTSPETPPNWVQSGNSFEVSCLGPCVVNAVGDVVVWATWESPDRLEMERAILLYPGSGAAPLVIVQDGPPPPGIEGEIIRVGTSMRINDAGAVVADYYLFGASSHYWIGLWGSGDFTAVAWSGAPAPGAAIFADGFGHSGDFEDLGAGRTLAKANSTAGGHGLICSDLSGAHLIASVGDPAPDSAETFEWAADSRFGAGGVVFRGQLSNRSNSANDGTGVFLAADGRIRKLVGSGDQVDGAGVIDSVFSFEADDDRRGFALIARLNPRVPARSLGLLYASADHDARRHFDATAPVRCDARFRRSGLCRRLQRRRTRYRC